VRRLLSKKTAATPDYCFEGYPDLVLRHEADGWLTAAMSNVATTWLISNGFAGARFATLRAAREALDAAITTTELEPWHPPRLQRSRSGWYRTTDDFEVVRETHPAANCRWTVVAPDGVRWQGGDTLYWARETIERLRDTYESNA
jgi:hypothetical protein